MTPARRFVLSSHGLTVQAGPRTLVQGLDLQIGAGECWCILGRNGSGKSSLLHTLAGLRPAAAGEVRLDDVALSAIPRRQLARRLGILFQDHQDPFPATVLETALTGRHPYLKNWQWEGEADRRIARQALADMALDALAERNVATLSGGERRRLGLATLLTQTPDIYLLDEPTNHLDLHHQVRLLKHLTAHSRAQGRALVMVLHDLNLAARFGERFLLLFGEGETLCGHADEVLRQDTLERLYGQPLTRIEVTLGTESYPTWLPA